MPEGIRSPTSAKVVAWLYIIGSISFLLYTIIQLIRLENSSKNSDNQNPRLAGTFYIWAIIVFVACAIQIAFSSLILVGLKTNSRCCLLPWLILQGFSAVTGCIHTVGLLISKNVLGFFISSFSTGLAVTAWFIVHSQFKRMGSITRNPEADV